MRVFISSTVYDLIDARSEIASMLSLIGASPVLSDDKLSDFTLCHDANSIETCLVNVDRADVVIVVLDQRYGPKLGSSGFEDISATHMEYRRAKNGQKPIYFYVRDRLEADFAIWRKNKGSSDLKLAWIDQKNAGLFEMLDEHRALQASLSSSNWYSVFSTTVDLKEAIQRQLDKAIKPQTVVNAIAKNQFPIFAVTLEAKLIPSQQSPWLQLNVKMINVGGSPAFNFASQSSDSEHVTERKSDIVPPNQTVNYLVLPACHDQSDYHARLSIKFHSVVGVEVQDNYELRVSFPAGLAGPLLTNVLLTKRIYRQASTVLVEIESTA